MTNFLLSIPCKRTPNIYINITGIIRIDVFILKFIIESKAEIENTLQCIENGILLNV